LEVQSLLKEATFYQTNDIEPITKRRYLPPSQPKTGEKSKHKMKQMKYVHVYYPNQFWFIVSSKDNLKTKTNNYS